MKLFIDCRMLGSGGIGTYLESILPFLVKEYNCSLLCTSSQVSKLEQYNSVAKIITTQLAPFSLKELFAFPKEIRLQINSCDAYYSPYCNVPGGLKLPVFTTIHDIVFLDVKGLSGFAGTLARKFFYQRAINRSKAVFTVSQFSAQRIKEKLNLKNKPLVVTYNSVPQWFIDNAKTSKDSTKDNSIIFVGNIKKHKGLATLLDAFDICRAKGLEAKLVIIGNADNFRSGDKETIQKLLNAQNKNIIFTGKISDSELCSYYSRANLLVQPSLYEGFGMPPLEALTCGTNVILSDIPVFKEIYSNLPVTFFKKADARDLAEKILHNFNASAPAFNNPYSFEKTFDIIKRNLYN